MRPSQTAVADKSIIRILLFVVFIVYILLLSRYILFTRINTDPVNYFSLSHIKASVEKGMRSANLRPFHTIKLVYSGKHMTPGFQYKNLAGNLLGFVPLAMLLPLLFRGLRSLFRVVVVVFMVSLAFELIQLCTGLGIFDIDDLILNTGGGIIGFTVHFFATLIYRQPLTETKAQHKSN